MFFAQAVLGDDGTVREVVGLESAITRIVETEELATLTPDQRQKLADRFAAYFEVRGQENSEAYISLMQSWGGRWRASPEDAAVRFFIDNGWHSYGTPCAIRLIDGEGIQCQLIQGVVNGRNIPSWPGPSPAPKAMGCGSLCVFDFGISSFELAKTGHPVAQIMIPTVEREDGTHTLMGIRFLWEPQSENWVPWMLHEISEPGQTLCTQLF